MLTTQLLSPALGYMMDRVGPKNFALAMAVLGMIGLAIGCVAIGSLVDFLLFITFPLLSVCSWMGSLLIVQLGFYFQGQNASRVILVLNTLFDSGALTYWLLWLFQDLTGTDTLNIWIGYMVVCACIFVGMVYFWFVAKKEPNHADDFAISTRYSHYESLRGLGDFEERMSRSVSSRLSAKLSDSMHSSFFGNSRHRSVSRASFGDSQRGSGSVFVMKGETGSLELKIPDHDGEDPSPNNPPAYKIVAKREPFQQLTSAPIVLLCVYFGIQVTSTNWNLSTQRDFLAHLGDDEKNNLYLSIFSLLTPVSILGVPFIDYAILNFGWTGALQGTTFLSLAYTFIKVASTNLNVQIISFVIFSFYRSFLFGTCFSFLPTLVSLPVIGRAAGIMFAIAAVTFFLTIPLARHTINNLDGDFFVPNLIFVFLNIPCFFAVFWLGFYLGKEKAAKALAEEGP